MVRCQQVSEPTSAPGRNEVETRRLAKPSGTRTQPCSFAARRAHILIAVQSEGCNGPPLQASGRSGRHPRGREIGRIPQAGPVTGPLARRSCVVPTLRPDLARAWPKACAVTGGFCSAHCPLDSTAPAHCHPVPVAPRDGHRHHRRDRLHRLSVLRHGRVPRGAALAETKMGALLSFGAAPLALVASRLLRARAT